MTEPELLENLSNLERTSKVLEIKIKVWKDEKGKLDLVKRNEEVKVEIEKLKRKLSFINENKAKDSQETKVNKGPNGSETPKKSEAERSKEKTKTVGEIKISEEPKNKKKFKVGEEKNGNEEQPTNNTYLNDIGQKQLSELELLRNLSQLGKDSLLLEKKIKTGNDKKEKITWTKQNEVIKERIEKLKKNLASINDKRYGEEAKSAIIRRLKENILEINDAGKEKIGNEFFEKKFGDLYFFTAEKLSIGVGPDLSSYKNKNNSPDIKELTDFLIQEIQTVTNIDEPNYLNLRDYLEGLKERIIARFVE